MAGGRRAILRSLPVAVARTAALTSCLEGGYPLPASGMGEQQDQTVGGHRAIWGDNPPGRGCSPRRQTAAGEGCATSWRLLARPRVRTQPHVDQHSLTTAQPVASRLRLRAAGAGGDTFPAGQHWLGPRAYALSFFTASRREKGQKSSASNGGLIRHL